MESTEDGKMDASSIVGESIVISLNGIDTVSTETSLVPTVSLREDDHYKSSQHHAYICQAPRGASAT